MDQLQLNNDLIEASKKGDISKVKDLIEKGANINHSDNDGDTPLLFADGYTPLISASRYGHLEIVKYLIKNGADVNKDDNFGWTPLNWASRHAHVEIIKYLVEHGANWPSIKKKPIFNEILKDQTNKLKSEITNTYLSIERGTPQTVTGEGKIKSSIPKNLILKTVYEKLYQEYCVPSGEGVPPIQLLALANILKLDYNIDISWSDLCNRVKNVLYRLL